MCWCWKPPGGRTDTVPRKTGVRRQHCNKCNQSCKEHMHIRKKRQQMHPEPISLKCVSRLKIATNVSKIATIYQKSKWQQMYIKQNYHKSIQPQNGNRCLQPPQNCTKHIETSPGNKCIQDHKKCIPTQNCNKRVKTHS